MLRKIFSILVFLFVFAVPVQATYDPLSVPNNKFGIHILDTSEIDKATELVNSTGGDWGYATIPIRANERNLLKWTEFMNKAREKHIIPILRIASFPVNPGTAEDAAHWMAPNEYDLVDFANFLDQLPWPIKNRYVVVYNEPNHKGEWGGFVYPQEYARVLDRAVDIFHKRNPDFFVISAGLDASAPDTQTSLNEYKYFYQMNQAWPRIFERIDGFSAHAYGNPGFETYPNADSSVNITSYRFEQDYLCRNFNVCNLKVFITEAGWKNGGWYQTAFKNYWTDDNIVAITPFLLNAQTEPFLDFSFVNGHGDFKPFAWDIKNLIKSAGKPKMAEKQKTVTVNNYQSPQTSNLLNLSSIGQLWKMISDIINLWTGR